MQPDQAEQGGEYRKPLEERIALANRHLPVSEARKVCGSPHLCLEYNNDYVVCGPCSIALAALAKEPQP